MFDHLVTPSGTKIAHEVGDLATYAACRGGRRPAGAGQARRRAHPPLGRRQTARGGSRYEIFHDVLAEPVLAWKAGHEAQRELERQRAEAERRHRRLLRALARRRRRLLVMAGVTVFALTQRSEARSQARLARARELAARRSVAASGRSAAQPRPRESDRQCSSARAEAEDVLRQALVASRERRSCRAAGRCGPSSFSPDGRLVLTASDDGSARIWRADGVLVRTLEQRGPVTAASFSPDGSLVLTAGDDRHGPDLARGERRAGRDAAPRRPRDERVVQRRREARRHDQRGRDGAHLASGDGCACCSSLKAASPVRSASLQPGRAHARHDQQQSRRAQTCGRGSSRSRPDGSSASLPANGVTTASFSPDGHTPRHRERGSHRRDLAACRPGAGCTCSPSTRGGGDRRASSAPAEGSS